jgi:hypothetical protein
MSPPVSTSAYGTESDMQYASETDENNGGEDEAADDNDGDEGTKTNRDIPPPPVDLLYDTLEDALGLIRGFTKGYGCALIKLRPKKGKDGEVYKVYL